MKQVLLFALFLAPSLAAASWVPTYPMSFSAPRKIPVFYYQNAEDCRADGGEWLADEKDSEEEEGIEAGMCFVDGGAHVDLTRDEKGQLNLSIGVVGTNAHTCDFEASAKMVSRTTYVAKAETEDYNIETEQLEAVTCEVTLTISKGGRQAAVSTNGKCRSFCGMRASLEFDEAQRVK